MKKVFVFGFIALFALTLLIAAQPVETKNEIEIGRDANHKPVKIGYNEKYSFKDFTTKTLLDATDLEGIVIFGSCFSKEIPDTKVFPDVKELTLINCNLDNVYLAPQWTVIGSSRRRFKVQADMQDWLVDEKGKPVKLLNEN